MIGEFVAFLSYMVFFSSRGMSNHRIFKGNMCWEHAEVTCETYVFFSHPKKCIIKVPRLSFFLSHKKKLYF